MTPKQATIDPRTRAILADMVIEGTTLLQYPNPLPRDEYVRLNEVLEALGGKWKRGSKKTPAGHVFPEDPTDRIENAIETGSYVCPRANDFFETPVTIVEEMIQVANVCDGQIILEPSAGKGAIADRVRNRARLTVHVVELLPENLDVLRQKGHIVVGTDFLEYAPEPIYDRILMNPPFSKKQDVIHVRRAYDLLKPGGRLVAIMAAGITFRSDRRTADLRLLIQEHGSIRPLPEGTFSAVGTEVNTVLVTIDKGRPS